MFRMEPTARRLIIDLLSTLREGAAMPVGALVEAGGLFGLSGNNVRVSIARLLAGRQITRDERGRYRLGERTRPIGRRVRSWRDLNRTPRRWSGGWIAVHSAATGRAGKAARERALRLLGFAMLQRGLWLRPDNLAASIAEVRAELAALGLPKGDLVFSLCELDRDGERRARCLWDVGEIRRTHRELRGEIARSTARLPKLSTGAAMAESYLLGGRALRHLILDPLLPEQICPTAERDALFSAMRDYDRLGRLAWASLLKRFDVPYLRTPLEARVDAELPRTAEAAFG
jgi:phenylacetic acid degradation operon negative regulatory protein